MSLDRYQLGATVAVTWNHDMGYQFPAADHTGCRQQMRCDKDGVWQPYVPARCIDYHCPKCGQPTNLMGHHRDTGIGCQTNQQEGN